MLGAGTIARKKRWTAVPKFKIRIVNDEFEATSEQEAQHRGAAVQSALQGAFDVWVEQVVGGKTFFAAEVCVADDTGLARFVVSVSYSALK
jgi:hypothetical protein